MPEKTDSAPARAETAAAARAARRAAQESEALRANLHRRKQQARSRAGEEPKTKPRPDAEAPAQQARKLNQPAETNKCR